tara:strand:+ start:2605 stop:4797 length:2193 start_codon:yes stop_codon:yes gene_type:complete
MANTLFKGDLAEVSFGKETGFRVDGKNSQANWTHTSVSGNTSLITLGADEYWTAAGPDLLIPDNILVGCTLKIEGGGNYTADDFATTKRTYYITANDTGAGTISVQPALLTTAATATADDDNLVIDFFRAPTFESTMTTGAQQVKTDQFIGLLNEFAIPEPQIDVRKQHVVGLGRDVNIVTSGRETMSGGNIQLNAHTLRWVKYALGGHTAKSQGEFAHSAGGDTTLTGASPLNMKDQSATKTYAGQKYGAGTVDTSMSALSGTTLTGNTLSGNFLLGALTASGSSSTIVFATNNYDVHFENVGTAGIFKVLSAAGAVLYGSYGGASGTTLSTCADIDSGAVERANDQNMAVYLLGQVEADVSAGDIRLKVGSANRAKFTAGTTYVQIIDKDKFTIPGQDEAVTSRQLHKHELRRVIALGTSNGNDADYIYVEEPFTFDHTATSIGVERLQYGSSSNRGSAHIDSTSKELQFGVAHTYFGHDVLPSFTIEQSFRQKDVEADSKQLLRLYSGCKATSATISADTEGEVKLEVAYEASRHYTETTNTITPHRMFDNTANTATNRKISGIAIDGEKPFLFQDVNVSVFGRPVLRGTEFSLQVANSTEARWFIRGYEGTTSDNDQVQHGATQMPLEITEGQREYTFTMRAMIEDDRMWEELRTRRHHRNTNDITITMTKVGSNATRETATITLEDYTIMKADHQVPSDKGPVFAEIELVVRHMKVTENSPYYIM